MIESEGARYRNVLSVPPKSGWAVALAQVRGARRGGRERGRGGEDVEGIFEDVGVRVFDRFEPVRKTFESEKDEGLRRRRTSARKAAVRAARTMEALDSERARGRNAKAGDEDDCLFVMTREVPWWERRDAALFFQCRNLCIRTNVSFSPLTPTSRAARTMSTRVSPSPRRRCARARARSSQFHAPPRA